MDEKRRKERSIYKGAGDESNNMSKEKEKNYKEKTEDIREKQIEREGS